MSKEYTVAALYCFAVFEDFEAYRVPLLALCRQQSIKGTLLLAREGINGTVAGSAEAIETLIAFLKQRPEFANMELKYSYADKLPFLRMKVRLKKEIVTMGVESVDPLSEVGQYISAKEWNNLITDKDTIVIDTRNNYEYSLGTFKGAIDPDTATFREFPKWVEENKDNLEGKKIAMFCTGGIRCEKATSYLRGLGYDNVFHLKGGILKYLEEIPESESLWQGECFVFDDRVSVGHGLKVGEHRLCHACRHTLSVEDMQSAAYEEGVTCPHCVNTQSGQDRLRYRERQKQIMLAKKRGTVPHLGQL